MKMISYQHMKLLFVCVLVCLPLTLAVPQVGFYSQTCPQAESIVRQAVQARFGVDKSVTAALLRMHFHDCFVRGCDASILIDSTSNNTSEKDAFPNLTVREYDLIDQIKSQLEAACPDTVSCADIIALATRDAVALAGGPRYNVPTGRRDGLVSRADEANLPGPASTVAQARQAFSARGLTMNDLVILMGGHSVGVTHCNFFQDRLSNFQGSGAPDPTMDSNFVTQMKGTCGSNPNVDPTVSLDQSTSFVVDNQYYNEIIKRKGLLQIDQEIALDNSTSKLVATLAANNNLFKQVFAKVMIKLGNVQVLEGNAGEIRKNCRVFNAPTPPPAPTTAQSPPPAPTTAQAPPPAPTMAQAPPPAPTMAASTPPPAPPTAQASPPAPTTPQASPPPPAPATAQTPPPSPTTAQAPPPAPTTPQASPPPPAPATTQASPPPPAPATAQASPPSPSTAGLHLLRNR